MKSRVSPCCICPSLNLLEGGIRGLLYSTVSGTSAVWQEIPGVSLLYLSESEFTGRWHSRSSSMTDQMILPSFGLNQSCPSASTSILQKNLLQMNHCFHCYLRGLLPSFCKPIQRASVISVEVVGRLREECLHFQFLCSPILYEHYRFLFSALQPPLSATGPCILPSWTRYHGWHFQPG